MAVKARAKYDYLDFNITYVYNSVIPAKREAP
jgi:hypothetical protein